MRAVERHSDPNALPPGKGPGHRLHPARSASAHHPEHLAKGIDGSYFMTICPGRAPGQNAKLDRIAYGRICPVLLPLSCILSAFSECRSEMA